MEGPVVMTSPSHVVRSPDAQDSPRGQRPTRTRLDFGAGKADAAAQQGALPEGGCAAGAAAPDPVRPSGSSTPVAHAFNYPRGLAHIYLAVDDYYRNCESDLQGRSANHVRQALAALEMCVRDFQDLYDELQVRGTARSLTGVPELDEGQGAASLPADSPLAPSAPPVWTGKGRFAGSASEPASPARQGGSPAAQRSPQRLEGANGSAAKSPLSAGAESPAGSAGSLLSRRAGSQRELLVVVGSDVTPSQQAPLIRDRLSQPSSRASESEDVRRRVGSKLRRGRRQRMDKELERLMKLARAEDERRAARARAGGDARAGPSSTERVQMATERRHSYLEAVSRRAREESIKVDEVHFIQELEAEGRANALRERVGAAGARKEAALERIRSKASTFVERGGSAQERKARMEEERLARLEASAKLKEAAQLRLAEERKLAHLAAMRARQEQQRAAQHKAELNAETFREERRRRLETRLAEADMRRSRYLAEIRDRAAVGKDTGAPREGVARDGEGGSPSARLAEGSPRARSGQPSPSPWTQRASAREREASPTLAAPGSPSGPSYDPQWAHAGQMWAAGRAFRTAASMANRFKGMRRRSKKLQIRMDDTRLAILAEERKRRPAGEKMEGAGSWTSPLLITAKELELLSQQLSGAGSHAERGRAQERLAAAAGSLEGLLARSPPDPQGEDTARLATALVRLASSPFPKGPLRGGDAERGAGGSEHGGSDGAGEAEPAAARRKDAEPIALPTAARLLACALGVLRSGPRPALRALRECVLPSLASRMVTLVDLAVHRDSSDLGCLPLLPEEASFLESAFGTIARVLSAGREEAPALPQEWATLLELTRGQLLAAGLVYRVHEVLALFESEEAATAVPAHVEATLEALEALSAPRPEDLKPLPRDTPPSSWSVALSLMIFVKETHLVRLTSVLTSVLLRHQAARAETPGPARDGETPSARRAGAPLPRNFDSVALRVLRTLNNFAILDIRAVQTLLALPDLRLEILHLLSFLLQRCCARLEDAAGDTAGPSTPDTAPDTALNDAMLDEVLRLLGAAVLMHPGNQAMLQWGRTPILKQLLALPSSYAGSARGAAVALPALLAAVFECPSNCLLVAKASPGPRADAASLPKQPPSGAAAVEALRLEDSACKTPVSPASGLPRTPASAEAEAAPYGLNLQSLLRYVTDVKETLLAEYKRGTDEKDGAAAPGTPMARQSARAALWREDQSDARYSICTRFPQALLPRAQAFLSALLPTTASPGPDAS
ncbi:unnamed protein product [Pedinophyceae sp. YPF-701]|nr:unnamed protein product [Pedinophyceae sp. YPF-701]